MGSLYAGGNNIAERILNHSRGKIEATYDLHGFLDEKRVALDKLGREIDRIVGQGKPAEIIPFVGNAQ